jgi:hypothetical protein
MLKLLGVLREDFLVLLFEGIGTGQRNELPFDIRLPPP